MEASVIHILKAMAQHAGAAQSLLEDDSLKLLFHTVAMGAFIREEGISEPADFQGSFPTHLAHATTVRYSLHIVFLLCNFHY